MLDSGKHPVNNSESEMRPVSNLNYLCHVNQNNE